MAEYKPAYERALELVLERIPAPGPTHRVPLSRATGRVAARTVRAPKPFPEQDLSMLDGLAVAGSTRSNRELAVRTGEPVPEWAVDVVPREHMDANDTAVRVRDGSLRPSIVQRGCEYRVGDPIIEAGRCIDHRHLAQLSLFGIGTIEVFRRPRVLIFVFNEAPFSAAVKAWITGFMNSYYAIDVNTKVIADLGDITRSIRDTDLGIVVSDGAPGRYDEIKGLYRGDVAGFETVFWKQGLSPPKHVGFGCQANVPVLVFPDVFFKTVLSAMAFLPAVLCVWVGVQPYSRSTRWDALPVITYPYPCLVPLRFDDELRGQKVTATPLASSFSARWASAAQGYVVLERTPKIDDEFDAFMLGRLGVRVRGRGESPDVAVTAVTR